MPAGMLPEHPSDNAAARDRIRRFLEKLPERSKEIFFLSVVGGFKPSEIASLLGLKPATVSNYLHRVRKLIKDEHPDLDADDG
jgi:RNA polymerase sigma-70 factor (ECF subfamily)